METQKGWFIGLLIAVLLAGCTLSACLVGAMVGGRIGYSVAVKQATRAEAPPAAVPPMPTWEPWLLEPPDRKLPGPEMRLAALVVSIVPGGPAAEAGVQRGDLILAVDDQQILPSQDLAAIIQGYRPGDRIRLTLLRDGRQERVRVRLGQRRTGDGEIVASLGLTYRLQSVIPPP